MGPKPKPLADRFWPKVRRGAPDDCWTWLGARLTKGYGLIGVAGDMRGRLAHRVSWEIHNAPIPDGLLVCHHCDNPSCVNPAHLFLGSHSDNLKDMSRKGRHRIMNRPAENRAKTACKHGHPFTPENTMWIERNGRHARRCRTCDRLANRNYKARQFRHFGDPWVQS